MADEAIVFIDKKIPLGKRLKSLLSYSQVWWIFCYGATTYVALPLLGAFWGTSYLETRGFAKPSAAFIISMVWVGLALGSPILGRLSDGIKRRKIFLATCSIVGLVSSILFLYTPSTNIIYLCFLFFLIGIGGSGQNISFALISEHSPKSLKATALGLNNTMIMGFAAIMSPFVTSVIQHFAKNQGGLSELAFEKGLLIIPIAFAISLVVVLFAIRETFCRQQNTVHLI